MFQHSARSIPGVLFIEDFDDTTPVARSAPLAQAQDVEPVVPAEPTEPGLSRHDLEDLRATAREEGFAAGYAAAEGGLVAERLAAIRKLENALPTMSEQMATIVHRDIELVANAALSLLAECLPALCERHGADETRAAFRSILESVIDEPELTVVVCPDILEIVKDELAAFANPVGRMNIVANPSLLAGDLRVSWEHGSASRDTGQLRRLLLERLDGLGFLNPRGKDPMI